MSFHASVEVLSIVFYRKMGFLHLGIIVISKIWASIHPCRYLGSFGLISAM